MKKIIILAIIFLFAASLSFAKFISTNQATLIWHEVITYDDNSYVKESDMADWRDQISYTIYKVDVKVDPDKQNPQPIVSSIKGTEYKLTFTQEGKYTFGVQAVRTFDGEIVATGNIVWMDSFLDTPDGIIYFKAPGSTTRIDVQ